MNISDETSIRIDSEKLRNWIKNKVLTYKEVSYELGQCDSFISKVIQIGSIPRRKLDLLGRVYGVDPHAFWAQDTRKSPPPNCTQVQGPYSLGLTVKRDRVRVSVHYEGRELYSAWSYIKGSSESDLMQAISYAAHMCYKMSEQNKLANNKED